MTLRDHHNKLTYGGLVIGLGGFLSGAFIPGVAVGLAMYALGQYYALSNLTGRRVTDLWRKPSASPRQASAPRRTH